MINNIIHIFRKQAAEHKVIKGFYYTRNYELGTGNETHPLFWVEDPLTGRNQDNIFTNSVNFSILFLPEKERDISRLQSLAFSVGLNIIERIKQDKEAEITIRPDWTFVTLRDYYDNNSCGCRFSVNFSQVNMQNLCLIEEQFELNGTITDDSPLNDFDIHPANNCEIFVRKLPDFDIKTRKNG